MSRAGIALRLGFCALLFAVLAAIVVQQLTLPLGLFNDGRATYQLGSLFFAALALLALLGLGHELWLGKPTALASGIRGSVVSLLMLEAMLSFVDGRFLSHPDARIGGPYREIEVAGHGPLPIKKPTPVSPFGFRWAAPAPKNSDAYRILFLGDSYVEGSGRSLACNYPEVAAEVLAARTNRPVVALNAGVAGAGPVEALGALRLMVAQGYAFDAVVHTLFLENDFSDDLPGTRRQVVAGVSFRFPASPWLSRLHPMNSTTVRVAMFVARASRLVRNAPAAAKRDPGRCRLEPEKLEAIPGGLRDLVLRRLEANYGPDSRVAEGVVRSSLESMRGEVEALGLPFVVAVLPDRILADADLRQLLDVSLDDYDTAQLKAFVAGLEGFDVVDLSGAVAPGSENYRPGDTHLSDLGNVRAGTRLGEALAARLRP